MSPDEPAAAPLELTVSDEFAGCRLDAFLARQFPNYSRMHLRRAINAAAVQVNGRRTKAAHHVQPGDHVRLVLPQLPRTAPEPEDIPLEVLFEDEYLAAINKPPAMVVHPSKGHWTGTLASALQFRFQALSAAGGLTRPGIVHRLDRDTSGVLVVAKTDEAHFRLADQFEQRTVEKEYFAIVTGRPDRDQDVIEAPIGPHPYQREKMAIRRDHPTSRPATTRYQVDERFDGFAAMRLLPKTGRTHQLRVHLASIGHPVLCDRQYGGRAEITRGEIRRDAADVEILLSRQALHARRLTITHPVSGERLNFVAPLPADLTTVLEELRAYRS